MNGAVPLLRLYVCMSWTSTTLPLLSVKSGMMFLWDKAGRLREIINSDVIELENVNGRDHLVDPNLDGKDVRSSVQLI